jgi:hypothetical protein
VIVGVHGLGAVGIRAVRELAGTEAVERVLMRSSRTARLAAAREAFGDRVADWTDPSAHVDVVVVASTPGTHVAAAAEHLAAGRSVVSTSDDPDDVRGLLDLDASAAGLTIGAAFSPGLSCLLVRHAAAALAEVHLVRVAMAGFGGPECKRRRVEARSGIEPAWRDGRWASAEGGPPELTWFPDPVGALDAVGGALIEPLLLHRALPDVPTISAALVVPGPTSRVTSMAARLPGSARRDQSREPLGAVRVEVSGRKADGSDAMVVYAVVDRPAVAAGAVAAVTATRPQATTPGVRSLGQSDDVLAMLHELARRGVKAATFEPAA